MSTTKENKHCPDCAIPTGASNPPSHTCWNRCPCHSPQNNWRERFKKVVKGRQLSKYHKNYIATHIVEALLEEEVQAAYERGRQKEAVHPENGELLTPREVYLFEKGKKNGREEQARINSQERNAAKLEGKKEMLAEVEKEFKGIDHYRYTCSQHVPCKTCAFNLLTDTLTRISQSLPNQ